MKKLFIILSLSTLSYLMSCDNSRGQKNLDNSKKIERDMTKDKVIEIMGQPDKDIGYRICYMTNDDSYPEIDIAFDSTGKIYEFYSPVKTPDQRKWPIKTNDLTKDK